MHPLASGIEDGGDKGEEDVDVEDGAGVVRVVVVVDDLLVDVAEDVAPEGDGGDDDDGEQVAVAEPDAKDCGDAEREVAEANLGLEAAVTAREADFVRDGDAVKEVEAASSVELLRSYRPAGLPSWNRVPRHSCLVRIVSTLALGALMALAWTLPAHGSEDARPSAARSGPSTPPPGRG